jgi:hypothetical protein
MFLVHKKQTFRDGIGRGQRDTPGHHDRHSTLPGDKGKKAVGYLLSCSILLDIGYLAWVCEQSLDKKKEKEKNIDITRSLDSLPTQKKIILLLSTSSWEIISHYS